MSATPGTAVASRQQDLVEWVGSEGRRAQLAKALPEGVLIDRFERMTHTALLAHPELLKADRTSLWLALLASAQAGLVPDGKQAAIVVFENRKKGITEATFMPMIAGVRSTLADFGWQLTTGVVHANDEFSFDEADGKVVHRWKLGTDRGDMIGAYAQARHKDGQRRMGVTMSKAEIDYVRDHSSKRKEIWDEWYTRMAEKTPAHRLAKKLPLDEKDRRRMDWILNATEVIEEPGAAARLLYGPEASASDPQPLPADEGEPGGEAEPYAPASPPDASHDEGEPDINEDATPEAAAGFVPPTGQFSAKGAKGPKTLAGILELGAPGEQWFKWALTTIKSPPEYAEAVWAFARTHLPELVEERP